MYRFLLTPKWIGFHLLCIAAIAGMVWAGFWQLGRYQDRQDFKREVQQRTDAPIDQYDTVMASGGPGDVEWRRVEATGTYVPNTAFEVVNVSQDGSSGHDAVNGLLLADGSVLIVNRGFVAGATPLPDAPTGEVVVVGRLRQSQRASIGQTGDDGSQQLTQIRRVDLAALTPQFDQPVQPVFLDMLESDPAEPASIAPVAFPDLEGGPPHLSYTFQWFIFSIAVAVGWVLAVRKSVNERKGKPKKRKLPPIAEHYAS